MIRYSLPKQVYVSESKGVVGKAKGLPLLYGDPFATDSSSDWTVTRDEKRLSLYVDKKSSLLRVQE